MNKNPPQGTLIIISTPIGNLGDISYRTVETLKSLDLLFCEDTRVTQKLLQHLNIKVPLQVYNDQATEKIRGPILAQLHAGKRIGLVSDAGTPLISDPGYKLVKSCHEQNISIEGVPGPVACIHGLVLSGLPTNEFYFCGFLPPKEKEKKEKLEALTPIPGTLIFYETGPKLLKTLQALHAVLGNRLAAIARELTKKFEEIKRGPLEVLIQIAAEKPPKGELVLLVQGHAGAEKTSFTGKEHLLRKVANAMGDKEASHVLSALLNQPRKEIYKTLIEMKDD